MLAHGHQPPASVNVKRDFRTVRPVRPTRAARFTRLAPVQRLAQIVEDVRRWLGEVLMPGQHEAVAEKAGLAEAVKPAESVTMDDKIAETVKPRTVREALQEERAARRKPAHTIRPPGRSRSIGV